MSLYCIPFCRKIQVCFAPCAGFSGFPRKFREIPCPFLRYGIKLRYSSEGQQNRKQFYAADQYEGGWNAYHYKDGWQAVQTGEYNAPLSTAAIHYRSTGSASDTRSFTDVPNGAWYADAVAWAVSNSITNGTGGNQFSPGRTCTRAEIVTFLFRDPNILA